MASEDGFPLNNSLITISEMYSASEISRKFKKKIGEKGRGVTPLSVTFFTYFFVNFDRFLYFKEILPISSLQMQWISVRFYEMGDICF